MERCPEPRHQASTLLFLPPPLTRMCLEGYFFRSLLLVADVMFHIPCIFMHSTWWNHSGACFLHLWSISHFLSPSLICPPSPLESLFLSWQLKFFPSYLLLPPQPFWWRVSSFSWCHWRRTPLTTSILEKVSHNPWTSVKKFSSLLHSTPRHFLFHPALKLLSLTIHTPSLLTFIICLCCGYSIHLGLEELIQSLLHLP